MTDFKKEVLRWAEEVGVKPKEIHVRAMKRKWASCSSKGRLSFAYALLNEPVKARAEPIIHELLHIRYPNHGKLFNALLKSHLAKIGF